jgi:hypothetical protein
MIINTFNIQSAKPHSLDLTMYDAHELKEFHIEMAANIIFS